MKLKDYLYDLFPVPDHEHFQMLPEKEQWRIIGQGEVMCEVEKFLLLNNTPTEFFIKVNGSHPTAE